MSGASSGRVPPASHLAVRVAPLASPRGRIRDAALGFALAALASLGPRSDARAEAPTAPWTFDALVAAIERASPLVAAAQAGLAELDARLHEAAWAVFPSVRIEAGLTLTPTITGDALASRTDWGTVGAFGALGVDLVQPLWTFGKLGALEAAASSGVDVGRAAVDLAKGELRVRAAEAFYGRLLARELEGILAEGKGWIDKATHRMERLRDAGSADYDQLEHLRLQTRVADFYVLQAQNQLLLRQTTDGLRLLLGAAPGTEVALAPAGLDPVACELASPERYAELARAHDPTLRVASGAAAAQHHLADAASAGVWPDLVLVGRVDLRDAGAVADPGSAFAHDPYHVASAGAVLGLRWPLDIPQRIFRIDEARARAARADAELAAARDAGELAVLALAEELRGKRALLDVMRQSQRSAQGWLTAVWDTYDAGIGSFRDVMDALVQFYQKKFGYLQLVYEHNVLVSRLARAVGAEVCNLAPASR